MRPAKRGVRKAILIMFLMALSHAMATEVEGYWLKEGKDGKEVKKGKEVIVHAKVVDGQLIGCLVAWKDKAHKVDDRNPDVSLRKRPLKGLPVLYGFVKTDSGWSGGHIYDANEGKTYPAKLWFESEDVMVVRGFRGLEVLGKSIKWKRIPDPNPNR